MLSNLTLQRVRLALVEEKFFTLRRRSHFYPTKIRRFFFFSQSVLARIVRFCMIYAAFLVLGLCF